MYAGSKLDKCIYACIAYMLVYMHKYLREKSSAAADVCDVKASERLNRIGRAEMRQHTVDRIDAIWETKENGQSF
jgi:hypothetical protein